MEKDRIQNIRHQAEQAFERTNGIGAYEAAQAMMLAEITMQLDRIATALEAQQPKRTSPYEEGTDYDKVWRLFDSLGIQWASAADDIFASEVYLGHISDVAQMSQAEVLGKLATWHARDDT